MRQAKGGLGDQKTQDWQLLSLNESEYYSRARISTTKGEDFGDGGKSDPLAWEVSNKREINAGLQG